MENTTEKKLYPSQINSKTISARIPVNDYVNFLQESLKNGISLNDWLLIKIYSNQADNIGNIKSEKSDYFYFRNAFCLTTRTCHFKRYFTIF